MWCCVIWKELRRCGEMRWSWHWPGLGVVSKVIMNTQGPNSVSSSTRHTGIYIYTVLYIYIDVCVNIYVYIYICTRINTPFKSSGWKTPLLVDDKKSSLIWCEYTGINNGLLLISRGPWNFQYVGDDSHWLGEFWTLRRRHVPWFWISFPSQIKGTCNNSEQQSFLSLFLYSKSSHFKLNNVQEYYNPMDNLW